VTEAVSHVKDPLRVEIGKRAMRARWGPRRVIRLDQLHPTVADAIRALVAADEAARSTPPEAA
jgi:hypothetical protein